MPDSKATILIVDDESINISVLMEFLTQDYRIIAAKNGHQALSRLADVPLPDLILLDIMMPEMDGFEVCQRVKSNPVTQHIPIIFVTAMTDVLDEAYGFEIGAADYISKPVSPPIVQARIKLHLSLNRIRNLLLRQNTELEDKVKERTKELNLAQDISILALATLAETRDHETGNHIRRTQHYVKALAQELAKNPKHSHYFTPETIELIYKSAPLHDIGKVGIPDAILLKPGKLSDSEFLIMKTHAILGQEAIQKAEDILGVEDVSFLHFAREIAVSHHEKWDGNGYPLGLSGDAIPLSGRLMAVADVYDALISKRVYKAAYPHETAIQIISEGSGKHFDPEVVDAFLSISEQFKQIASRYQDINNPQGTSTTKN